MSHIEIGLADWIDVAPWKSRLLLIIDMTSETQASSIGDKRAMLAADHPGLVAVWPGQWRTSARQFGKGDAVKVADQLA